METMTLILPLVALKQPYMKERQRESVTVKDTVSLLVINNAPCL